MTPFPSLVLPEGNLGPRSRKPQAASVAEAIRWPKGGSSSQTFTQLFTFRDYGVGVRKPGKEAELDPPKRNENDMLPTVVKTGSVVEYAPGFITIFEELSEARCRAKHACPRAHRLPHVRVGFHARPRRTRAWMLIHHAILGVVARACPADRRLTALPLLATLGVGSPNGDPWARGDVDRDLVVLDRGGAGRHRECQPRCHGRAGRF